MTPITQTRGPNTDITCPIPARPPIIPFVEQTLGLSLYPWQREVLGWFENPALRTKGTVAAPNGSGKDDRVIAGLAIWWLSAHPRGRVVVTSKDSRQIDQQTAAAIAKHAHKLSGWRFLKRSIETETGGRAILFTTNEPGRAEGWHKEDDMEGPLLIVVNEAKSVPDNIFEAFDRCTYNALLYISSAGLMMGRFFDSHTKLATQFRSRIVRLDECPHIPQARIDDIVQTYGASHPFTRSTLYSEFMSQDDASSFVFPLELLHDSLRNPPPFRAGLRSAFCDFAAGRDENVLAIRHGNKVTLADAWRDTNTMSAVGRFIRHFERRGLEAHEIFADAGGLGTPMCDRLEENGWAVNRVNFGAAAQNATYMNRAAEMWFTTATALARREIAFPENDSKLIAQLTTRRVKLDSDGRLGLVSKEQMRKENLASPDRADAVCGAWACCAGDWVSPGMNASRSAFDYFAHHTGEAEDAHSF